MEMENLGEISATISLVCSSLAIKKTFRAFSAQGVLCFACFAVFRGALFPLLIPTRSFLVGIDCAFSFGIQCKFLA